MNRQTRPTMDGEVVWDSQDLLDSRLVAAQWLSRVTCKPNLLLL